LETPPQTPEEITAKDVRALVFVIICGAVGGFLYWVLAALAGQKIANWPVHFQILAMVFVGAVAGLFGVYLLTASDLRAMKTFIFAIVCGLVWQPILQSAKGLVANATATKQVAQLDTKTNQIKATAENGTSDQVKSDINSAASALKNVVNTLSNVQDTTKRNELLDTSKNAIDAVESGFAKAPEATVNALQDIGIESAKASQPEVTTKAIQSLNAVGLNAIQKSRPDVALQAYQSIQRIGSQSTDTTVKDTAASSMKDLHTTQSGQGEIK
jgi:hypothetical protein